MNKRKKKTRNFCLACMNPSQLEKEKEEKKPRNPTITNFRTFLVNEHRKVDRERKLLSWRELKTTEQQLTKKK